MFVYYFVQLSDPFEVVERRLLERLEGVDGWADAAYREGEVLLAKLRIGGEGSLVAKTVRIDVGQPVRRDAGTIIPLIWQATGTPRLFPRMQADLVVAAVVPELTQVSLRGSYQPPLGELGRVLDRTLLHRVAEASVKSFVDRLAEALEADEHG